MPVSPVRIFAKLVEGAASARGPYCATCVLTFNGGASRIGTAFSAQHGVPVLLDLDDDVSGSAAGLTLSPSAQSR